MIFLIGLVRLWDVTQINCGTFAQNLLFFFVLFFIVVVVVVVVFGAIVSSL